MIDDSLILPFLVLDAEEAIENFTEGPHMVEVVQDNDAGEFPHPCILTLFCDVGQVLPEFLGWLVVHIKGRHWACCKLLTRSV